MSEVVLVRGEDGKLQGLGERGARAYAKFRRTIEALDVGETIKFQWWAPRSPKFHRRHFALLGRMFEQQEQFTEAEAFRMWVQVGAGHCDLVPGPGGKPVAIPRSIAWHQLDDDDFYEHHQSVVRFMRSPYFARFLWPHLTDQQATEMVEGVLAEFEA